MKSIKLENINIGKFKREIYPHYLEIFPEEERKSLKLIQSSYEKQYTKIIEILYDNKIVGFMLLNQIEDNGYIGLDYLAILPQYRNSSFGTKALHRLLEQEKESKGIFIEIEKVGLGKSEEENLLRERRKNFYEKVGFKKLNFDLFLFDVIYTPYLCSNIEVKEDIIIAEMFNIYESISGKKKIRENCKII